MHEPVSTTVVAYHGILALFGGFVHALEKQRTGQSKGLRDLLVLSLISSFSGVMFALLAGYWFPHDHYLSMVAAGSGGYLGVEGMSIIAAWITRLITK